MTLPWHLESDLWMILGPVVVLMAIFGPRITRLLIAMGPSAETLRDTYGWLVRLRGTPQQHERGQRWSRRALVAMYCAVVAFLLAGTVLSFLLWVGVLHNPPTRGQIMTQGIDVNEYDIIIDEHEQSIRTVRKPQASQDATPESATRIEHQHDGQTDQ